MNLSEILDHIGTGTKHLLDLVAAFIAVGAFVQYLPPLAAGFTVVWCGLQIFGWIEARWKKRGLDELDKG